MPLPLAALLSQAFVAFTIEVDNEFEHLMAHRTSLPTSSVDPRHGPWLTSAVMWFTCLRFLDDDGMTLGELGLRARTPTNVDGMRRWGYIEVESDQPAGSAARPGPGSVARPTAAGRLAGEVWRASFGVVEERWRERFGGPALDYLRDALITLLGKVDLVLPDCLPILGNGLSSHPSRPAQDGEAQRRAEPADVLAGVALPALLAKVLLAMAIAYEATSPVSLAISANVLRVVGDDGIRVRDVPLLGGVSKESVAMATGYLQRNGFAELVPMPTPGRGRFVRVTPSGAEARESYLPLLADIERRWRSRFGPSTIDDVRTALEPMVGDGGGRSPLFLGLEPYPDGWRAEVRRPSTLPHYPMVLHRGGYPDGS